MRDYRHLENKQDKMVRHYAEAFCDAMGWKGLDICRFKLVPTEKWRGYSMALACQGQTINAVLISNSKEMHSTEDKLWHTTVHELVHLRLYQIGYPIDKAFGHGKAFKNMCKLIEQISDGELTYKGLTR